MDVRQYTARLGLERVAADELIEMSETAAAAAQNLSHADIDVLAYECTMGSLVEGREHANDLETSLSNIVDAPVVTSNQATLRDALRRTSVNHSEVDLGRLFEH